MTNKKTKDANTHTHKKNKNTVMPKKRKEKKKKAENTLNMRKQKVANKGTKHSRTQRQTGAIQKSQSYLVVAEVVVGTGIVAAREANTLLAFHAFPTSIYTRLKTLPSLPHLSVILIPFAPLISYVASFTHSSALFFLPFLFLLSLQPISWTAV